MANNHNNSGDTNGNFKSLGTVFGTILLSGAFLALWLSPQGSSARMQGSSGGVNYAVTNAPIAEQAHITVKGTGIVSAGPDLLNVQVGVQTQNGSLGDAQWDAATKMTAALDELKKAGIEDKDIRTASYTIEPVLTYPKEGPPQPAGFRVTSILNIIVRDVSKAGKLIDALGKVGVNRVQSLSFAFSDPTALLKQARDAAMNDAKQKAQQFAAQGGVALGLPILIEDLDSNTAPKAQDTVSTGFFSSPTTPINSGQQVVRADVSVIYAIK